MTFPDRSEEKATANVTLMPDRYPQYDLFVCDVADAVLKDVMPMMEHPFYSLSKKPETAIRRYEHKGNWVEITPSVKGLATIYDKDILIYCISQVMAKLRAGEKVSKRVRIISRDLLMFTNRSTSGREYKALINALDRLQGTVIRTNIITGDEEQTEGFGLIDASAIKRKYGLDGRLLWCEVVLSDWVFNAIQHNEVLTLNRDYFRLSKPIDKRLYELARKHCGSQKEWKVSVSILHKKTGSKGEEKKLRKSIRAFAKSNHLPDYLVSFDTRTDTVTFTSRETVQFLDGPNPQKKWDFHLPSTAYKAARKAAPRWDVYYLEQEWRAWLSKENINPRNPERHFEKFCKSWDKQRMNT
ncbi:MAG: Plasmid replication initiator protein [Candidatus Tokpelaia sp. JSC189]|nr:MAG: Plasmid replication initiator protein [Candidatus Tokpelaia sp. JSC189]